MNNKRIFTFLAICLAFSSLTLAQATNEQESNNESSAWQKWWGITTNVIPRIWGVITGSYEKTVIIQRVNVEKEALIHEPGDHPAGTFVPVRPKTKHSSIEDGIYDEWIMISAPIAVIVCITFIASSSVFSCLKSFCPCCC